jgi:HAD superfamily hydrolase (TIGR01509 family)
MHLNKIQLVVFDLDGVIIDSEWAHEAAKMRIRSEMGISSPIDLAAFTGTSNRVFWQTVLAEAGLEGDVDDLVRRQFAYVLEELKKADQPEMPGLSDLLQFLERNGIKVAVSSGSEEYFIRSILEHLRITAYFDVIVTGNDMVELKPAPDIYLAALRFSGVSADRALTIEDSKAGCQAAQAAGMKCIGYTNGGKNTQDLSRAEYRVDHIRDTEDIILKLEESCR